MINKICCSGGIIYIETKGQKRDKDETKHRFLEKWVKAVNHHGGFGRWSCDVSENPKDVEGIIEKVMGEGRGQQTTG